MQHIIMPLKMSHPIFEKKLEIWKNNSFKTKEKKNYEAVTKGLPFPVIRSAQMKL